MAKNTFLAGVGRALFFDGNNLIGVGKTFTDTTFNYSISKEEIRAGAANALYGQYFHDSALGVTITDAMFNLDRFAYNLGVNVEEDGAIVWYETEGKETIASGGKITLAHTPVAFNGTMLAWYKKPSDANWSSAVPVLSGSKYQITISGATSSDVYCIKYPYQDENARYVPVKVNYIPKTVHIVIFNDMYAGDSKDVGSAEKYGRIITDIPRFQFAGNMDLSLTSTSAATMPLTGNALAVDDEDSCTVDAIYGTVTEEIYNSDWRDRVTAIAIENSDIELAVGGKETLIVRAIFGNSSSAVRKDNSNFTFAKMTGSSGTSTINASTGEITGAGSGTTVFTVTLKDHSDIVAYATATIG